MAQETVLHAYACPRSRKHAVCTTVPPPPHPVCLRLCQQHTPPSSCTATSATNAPHCCFHTPAFPTAVRFTWGCPQPVECSYGIQANVRLSTPLCHPQPSPQPHTPHHYAREFRPQPCPLLRSDMGTGKPVIMWSRVRLGTGTGSGLLYPGNTVPFSTVSRVCTSTKLPVTHVTSKLPDHHHHSTPNHRREQLLAGWKRGARMASKQPQLPQHGPNDVNHRLGL
jgi:hypothetical protein